MAFSVSPATFDAGVLDPGEVVNVDVTFSDVPADVSGGGSVVFGLGGQSATLSFTVTIDNANVVLESTDVDEELTDVTVDVINLTNAGATIVIARA